MLRIYKFILRKAHKIIFNRVLKKSRDRWKKYKRKKIDFYGVFILIGLVFYNNHSVYVSLMMHTI